MKKNPLNFYKNFLDKLVNILTDGPKLMFFIKEKKTTLLGIFLGILIIGTSLTVLHRGECLNCAPLTVEEATYYKQNPQELVKLSSSKIFGPYTTLKTYLRDLIFPLTLNLIGFLFVFSTFYIFYHTIRLLLLRFKINPNTSINLDKFFKKND
tara:strand:+ start:266 stop:724 length:459 start_codon:yes stop_codon:yes gene_type:complete